MAASRQGDVPDRAGAGDDWPDTRRHVSRRVVILGALGAAAGGAAALHGLTTGRTPALDGRSDQPTLGGQEGQFSARDVAAGEGVRFTALGPLFQPQVELAPDSQAQVLWLDRTGTVIATGTQPTIEIPADVQSIVSMHTDFDAVRTVNLGFDADDDKGRYGPGPAYNKAPENAILVQGLPLLRGLKQFLAAGGPLSGTLDLSHLANLEYVECFGAQVQAVNLAGCNSLVRLSMDGNDLSELDLNPVRASLCDLRAARQRSGELRLVALDGPLSNVYHFCVVSQRVRGHPAEDQLPACEELWNWNAMLSGDMPLPKAARDVRASGNAFETVMADGRWTDPDGFGILDLTDNNLHTIDLDECRALVAIRLSGNRLDAGAVDQVLAEVDSWNKEGRHLHLEGGNAPPSEKGARHADRLRLRGWEVTLTS